MTRRPYPSDLTDLQWTNVEHPPPQPKPGGRPRKDSNRDPAAAIFYAPRTGRAWRPVPHDFPPRESVYAYFRRRQDDGARQRPHDALRDEIRGAEGRAAEPTAGVLDGPSVKTTSRGGERGYDAGKKIGGRQRRPLVDCLGLPPTAAVHPADVRDRDGAKLVLEKARGLFPSPRLLWADGGHAGALIAWVQMTCGWLLQTVPRPAGVKGFVLLPRRRAVERTLGWLGRYRRLSKDYEYLTSVSETMMIAAMIHLMARRNIKT